jgi:protease IV
MMVAKIHRIAIIVLISFILLLLGGCVPYRSHKIPLQKDTYLDIGLTGRIADFHPEPAFQFSFKSSPPTLTDLDRALKRAATDRHIVGVILRPMGISGFAGIRELRAMIEDFKTSHKPVYAYLEVATDRDYYLASIADSIIIAPTHSGGLSMMGLGISLTYMAKTFEKIGIKFHVLHAGQFKGAYENYGRDSMSEPLRNSLQYLLDDLYNTYTNEIATARPKLTAATLNQELLHGKQLIINGQDAVNEGFADVTMDWGDLREHLKKGDKFRTVTPAKYLRSGKFLDTIKKEIAVVHATGEIVYKQGDQGFLNTNDKIDSDDMVKQLRELREDNDVVAIVLRVDSPGGSSLASEVIAQEVLRLKAKKPVVVSMGDVAASGGYYISCGANRIVAQPNTITGSIGVVGMMPTAEELFKKIGARVETVEKGKWANFFRIDKDFSPEQEAVVQALMNGIYDEFVQRVAVGRRLPEDTVRSVAEGRVWTGTQALDRRLVDELGGLGIAIKRARELGGKDAQAAVIRNYPREGNFLRYFLRQINSVVLALRDRLFISFEERELRNAMDQLKRFMNHRDFVQMVMPYELQ